MLESTHPPGRRSLPLIVAAMITGLGGGVLSISPSGWGGCRAASPAFAGSMNRVQGGAKRQPFKQNLHASAGPGIQGKDEIPVRKWRRRELGRILRLAIPALSIPLADPIMSLVDSVCSKPSNPNPTPPTPGPKPLALSL